MTFKFHLLWGSSWLESIKLLQMMYLGLQASLSYCCGDMVVSPASSFTGFFGKHSPHEKPANVIFTYLHRMQLIVTHSPLYMDVCRLQEITLFLTPTPGDFEALDVYDHIINKICGIVWFRLFLFASLSSLWWQNYLTRFFSYEYRPRELVK